MAQLDQAHAEIRELLGGRDVQELLSVPPNQGSEQHSRIRLLYGTFLAAYLSGRGPVALLAFAVMARLSIQDGPVPLSSYAFRRLRMVLSLLEIDLPLGRAFGELGIALCEQFPDVSTRCKTHFLFASDVQNWTASIRQGSKHYRRANELAFACGTGSRTAM